VTSVPTTRRRKAQRSVSATLSGGEKSIIFDSDYDLVVEDEHMTVRPWRFGDRHELVVAFAVEYPQLRLREPLARPKEQIHCLFWRVERLIGRFFEQAPTRSLFLRPLLVVETRAPDPLSDAESQVRAPVLSHPSQ